MNDAQDAGERWRDKYLDALEVQEGLEKQLDTLRHGLWRALVQVSAVVEDEDPTLDEALSQLRERLRAGDIDSLAPLLQTLDEAAETYDQQKRERHSEVAEHLAQVVEPLEAFNLPRSLRRTLRDYLSRLPRRARETRLYPALLEQLADIQRQAVAQLQQPQEEEKPGLMQRLRGNQPKAAPPTEATSGGVSLAQTCNHISGVLQDLLGAVQPESVNGAKLRLVGDRIERGLDWETLLPVIDDVRDLVMQSYLAANSAFAEYLAHVNGELAEIYSDLGGAVAQERGRREQAKHLHGDMAREVASLAEQASGATDLQQLKRQVKSQLGSIREVLDQYQSHQDDEQPLTDQLEKLSSRIKTMEAQAEKSRADLEEQRHKALHDPLTGLPNRESYDERIAHEHQRWERYGHPLALAICDIDHFKQINDSFGHQAGDRVLKVISRTIAQRLRQVDFFGRYGGEEFVVILPETALEDAYTALDKIRDAIAGTAFHYREQPLKVTLSMGVAQFSAGDTVDAVLGRADQALYRAKSSGRNRCEKG